MSSIVIVEDRMLTSIKRWKLTLDYEDSRRSDYDANCMDLQKERERKEGLSLIATRSSL